MSIALNSDFVAWIAAFLDDASHWSAQHRRELIEQLDRASLSVLLNTAEGNGIEAVCQDGRTINGESKRWEFRSYHPSNSFAVRHPQLSVIPRLQQRSNHCSHRLTTDN
jgi:hypothetical protein